jgi:transcription elongation factor Elf1
MDPEDAIRKMFAADEPKTVHCPKCGDQTVSGLLVIDEEGNTRCPICGLIATVDA